MKKLIALLALIASLVVLVISCSSSGGGGTTIPEIAAWLFVDGNGANGINKDVAQDAGFAQTTAFNSKLYTIWSESTATAKQIRVAVYNGLDSSPSWTFVDGGGTNGINRDTAYDALFPQLTVHNAKLYATWQENNGVVYQIRIAVYNGDDGDPSWTFVDGGGASGINKNPSYNANDPQLIVFNSKLYATWSEDYISASQIHVAVFNEADNLWSFVEGVGASSINKDDTKIATGPQLTVHNSKLYATWVEDNGTANQIRVEVYNGNDSSPSWSFVDGGGASGINKSDAKNATCPQLTVHNSKLYATWMEYFGITSQIRVAVYNEADNAWSFVDGNRTIGINKDDSKSAQFPQLTVHNSKLYATWRESNGPAYQIRIAVYNGNSSSPIWTFVDGAGTNGINKDAAYDANVPQLTVLGSKLYATWFEYNGTTDQIRVSVGQ